MEFTVASVAVEADTTITVPEVSVTTSVSEEPIVGLTSTQVELVPVSHPVMEKGSGSTSAGLSPANDIMEELAIKWCNNFLLS